VYKERKQGYLSALRQHGLPVDESLIITGNTLNAEEGQTMTRQLLSLAEPPDGLFASNDTSAVSAIQVARQKGFCVPKDLAVIGFNNDPVSMIIDPPLSTVAHPAVNMGKIAAQQVLKHKEYKDIVTSETITLRTQLIIRESSRRKEV
jgi:LacI family transcriptional regulator